MSDPSAIPPLPEGQGLPDKTALAIYHALLKRYFELTLESMEKDMAIASDFDDGPSLESLTARAKWWKKIDLIFETDKLFDRRYSGPKGELQLVQEIFGEQLGIDPLLLADDIEKRLDWYKRRIAADYARTVKERIDNHSVASPIEQIFLMEWHFLRVEERFGVVLTPQLEVTAEDRTYRIDFGVTKAGKAAKLGIELDGHAFHERTPSQAAKDKQRERALIRQGFTILRFTGTEMVRNPRQCLTEVVAVIEQNVA
jgi:very-short-patch-repair endonuclease